MKFHKSLVLDIDTQKYIKKAVQANVKGNIFMLQPKKGFLPASRTGVTALPHSHPQRQQRHPQQP
ncbi:hypothetical protein [Prevotella sp. kh1p2]|uniref:hypothetical protein n=1 Tax=Prevotella sp. kh1p2 TaxID=1761883 RepID=UPI000B827CDC|nr:hypothetical protein [Prevotella sp. kh1p2]